LWKILDRERSVKRRLVAVHEDHTQKYPAEPPFNPPKRYRELTFIEDIDASNSAYESVRSAFGLLGYDLEHSGTERWNPLGWLISPGDTVMLKPNMVAHKHLLSDDWDYVVTHGSVIRAVADYVYLALEGRGRIVIADGPQSDSLVDRIVEVLGIGEMQEFYRTQLGFSLEFIDLRSEFRLERGGVWVGREPLGGDPSGSMVFDLAGESLFAELGTKGISYYGSDYDVAQTQSHHSDGKHEYSICRTPILADVFINIPKLKTHKKCGLTANLKSVVGGLNADKNYLPHYIIGSPAEGGDQFDKASLKNTMEKGLVAAAKSLLRQESPIFAFLAQKLKPLAYRIFGKTTEVVRSGNWYGNNTVWRMCLDLNKILFYGTPDGTLSAKKKKRYLSVVDGIHAMEGDGPTGGTLREAGLVIVGDNPVSVDAVCAALMGFDYRKIMLIERAFDQKSFPLIDGKYDNIGVVSNNPNWAKPLSQWNFEDSLKFRPHFGWRGHIEL
jgi:uncharacterized protein (DUF362 family)